MRSVSDALPGSVYYQASLDSAIADLQPLYDRLIARGKIPALAAVKPLSSEHIQAVLALHIAEFDCTSEMAERRLVGDADTQGCYCRRCSMVLTLAEKIIGAFLFFSPDPPGTVFAYAVVITSAWRNTWANAFLKFMTFKRLKEMGIDTIQLRAATSAADTHKHAARVSACILRKESH